MEKGKGWGVGGGELNVIDIHGVLGRTWRDGWRWGMSECPLELLFPVLQA